MQDLVRDFLQDHTINNDRIVRYVDLVTEVGELGKEMLKGSDYGQRPHTVTSNTQSEIGDCLFSLLALCEAMGIDAEAALQCALAKYEARFVEKGEIGSC